MAVKFINSEILLNNYLDKQFQAMMLPLNICYYIYLSPKYLILDNFITPNNSVMNLMNILSCLSMSMVYAYRIVTWSFGGIELNSSISFAMMIDWCFFSIGFVINSISNIANSEKNVRMLVKLHTIYSIKRDKNLIKWNTRLNWIYFIGVVTFYVTIIIYSLYVYGLSLALEIIHTFILMYFDLNVVYDIRLITIIRHELESWVSAVNSDHGNYLDSSTNEESRSADSNWIKMFDVYTHILEAYKIYTEVVQSVVGH